MAIPAVRNSVLGAVTAYAAGAFVTLQAADIFLPALLFPDWVLRFLVLLALLGLPVTAVTVWLVKLARSGSLSLTGKRRGRTRLLYASVLLVAVVGSGAAFVSARPENIPVRERDWIVLSDCSNETGEQGIERALTDALLSGLRESRYVNVLPRNRVSEALQRMKRNPREPLTREAAIELGQREGIAGVLTCGITKAGDGYIFNTAIVNPQTSEPAWSHAATAAGRDDILRTIETVSREVRASLGESRTALWREAKSLARVTTSSLEALKLYTSAEDAWINGKYPEAAQLYEAAVQRDTLFARAHAALGYYYHWNGDRQRGEAHLTQAERLIDGSAERERLWLIAYIRGSRADREGAVKAYQAYLQAYPDDRDAWYNLGNALMFLDRCSEAVPAFRRALDIDSLFVQGWVNTGTCFGRDFKNREALPYLLRAQQLNPKMFDVGNLNHELGLTYIALGDLGKARAIYEQRLAGNNYEQAGAHRSLALLEAYQGRYVIGMREMTEAVSLARASNSTLAEVRNRLYLAAFARRAGSNDVAQRELARVTEIADTFYMEPRWLHVFGRLQLSVGQSAQARRVLAKLKERVNAQNQDDGVALNLLQGELLLQSGDAAGAIELLEVANAVRHDGFARDPLARAYAASGQLDKSAELYQSTVDAPELLWEAQESWFDAHLQLARIAETRRDTASALKHYSRMLELWRQADSEFPDLRQARSAVRALSAPRDVAR
jgi:tetratricopeptide (TPR) repeat protein